MFLTNSTISNVFVFVSLLVWGLYIPVRQFVNEKISGQLVCVHFFLAEISTTILLVAVFGNLSFRDSSWFDENYMISNDDAWKSVMLVFAGGLAVGTGDFVAVVVMEHVPGCIGFPVVRGFSLSHRHL